MGKSLLNIFKERVANCHTMEDFTGVLKWGVEEVERLSLLDSTELELFQKPIAAMAVEVYFSCPDAVEACSELHQQIETTIIDLISSADGATTETNRESIYSSSYNASLQH